MTAVTGTFNHRLRRHWARDRHLRCLQRAILLSTMTRQHAPITLPKVRTLVEIQAEMLQQRYLVFDHGYDVGVTNYLGELGDASTRVVTRASASRAASASRHWR